LIGYSLWHIEWRGLGKEPDSPPWQRDTPWRLGLPKAAAIQYAKENIRINSVHPGYCETPLTIGGYTADAQRRDWSIARTPLGAWALPMILPMACSIWRLDESAYVTGAELVD